MGAHDSTLHNLASPLSEVLRSPKSTLFLRFVKPRNVKQVDPSHPVPYRSGFVFEQVMAGQVRTGCGPQNG